MRTIQAAYQPFKYTSVIDDAHISLYVDNGPGASRGLPFAIVHDTQEQKSRSWDAPWRHGDVKIETKPGARFAKIKDGVIPDYFFAVMFKDIAEALEQLDYYLSLNETDRSQLFDCESVSSGNPATALRVVRSALEEYFEKASKLGSGSGMSRQEVVTAMTELVKMLLRKTALTVSPFTPDCSVFEYFANTHTSNAIVNHVYGLKYAADLFERDAANSQEDLLSDSLALMVVVRNFYNSTTRAEKAMANNFFGSVSRKY